MTTAISWRSLPITNKEVSLARVLRCGQTFRWKNVDHVWSFSTKDMIILLKQDQNAIHFGSILPENKENKVPAEDTNDIKINKINKSSIEKKPLVKASIETQADPTLDFINDYFNLSIKLESLYEEWSQVEKKQKTGSRTSFASFPGIRILRQEPWETVVLFICSSNNNVKRISKMCDTLCEQFGEYLNHHNDIPYYTFPGPEALAAPEVEQQLRDLGFGYRAKYIQQTAQMFMDKGSGISLESLNGLREKSYEEAHSFLLKLKGVGPKVADCICLMALDKHHVVPVDTHVLQIAIRDYKFRGAKTMTQKSYPLVRSHFQELFGEYAGWAQLVMFAADLSDLNNGLNQKDGIDFKHEHDDRKDLAEIVEGRPVKQEIDRTVKQEKRSKPWSDEGFEKRIKVES